MKISSKSWIVSIFCFFLLLSSNEIFSQEHLYIVDDIRGIVLINKSDTVKIGDTIPEHAKLDFSDNKSLLKLYESKTDKFPIISPLVEHNKGYETSINNFLTHPHNAMTKGDIEIKTIKNFSDYYSAPVFLIIDENRVKVNIPKLKIDSNNFMYVSYTYSGNEMNYILAMEDEYLLINEDIFTFNDKIIEPDSVVSIWYYRTQEKKKNVMVENFNPLFINHSEYILAISEKADLLNSLNNSNLSDIVNPLLLIINNNYGFIDENNLTIWLNNRYKK